ncbi:MAG: 5'/3'-nucleotidase SurE [Endomicrobia bacterium]|nr:5'/3'-nucleotidase SurE [Endomicrobiia bacterium]
MDDIENFIHMKRYKILVTNDDGLFSEGLLPLVRELKKIAELCIIIPEKEMSAVSHSLTLQNPVRVRDIKYNGFDIKLVSGTPADCVRLGIIEFQKCKTDIVVSGINHGSNLGYDVNYSGTVAAAREAVLLRKTGVALSTSSNNYNIVAKYSKEIVKQLLKLKKTMLLNINFPHKPRGIKITILGERRYEDIVHKKIDPIGLPYYWLKSNLLIENKNQKPITDIFAIKKNYISITPLTLDITDYNNLKYLKNLF